MTSVARTISNQIRAGKTNDGTSGNTAMNSWGARQLTDLGGGLAFRVSGLKFKGIVEVVLDVQDLYTVKFIKAGMLKRMSKGLFCSQLAAIIDEVVKG